MSCDMTCAGPCISTDTACSSSLVATHLAHTGITNRESVAAVAGGVNLMLDPVTTVAICQLQVDARDTVLRKRHVKSGKGRACHTPSTPLLVCRHFLPVDAANHLMPLVTAMDVVRDSWQHCWHGPGLARLPWLSYVEVLSIKTDGAVDSLRPTDQAKPGWF